MQQLRLDLEIYVYSTVKSWERTCHEEQAAREVKKRCSFQLSETKNVVVCPSSVYDRGQKHIFFTLQFLDEFTRCYRRSIIHTEISINMSENSLSYIYQKIEQIQCTHIVALNE